jgi:hypothetical protein
MIFVAAFYLFPSLYVIYLLVTQGPSGVGA